MTEPEFVGAILANPDNQQLQLTFADWLEEQGDFRGELIRCYWATEITAATPIGKLFSDELVFIRRMQELLPRHCWLLSDISEFLNYIHTLMKDHHDITRIADDVLIVRTTRLWDHSIPVNSGCWISPVAMHINPRADQRRNFTLRQIGRSSIWYLRFSSFPNWSIACGQDYGWNSGYWRLFRMIANNGWQLQQKKHKDRRPSLVDRLNARQDTLFGTPADEFQLGN